MPLDERAFFTDRPETRPGRFQCPRCHRTGDYTIRWVRRVKKDRLPAGADDGDRARFAKVRDYLLGHMKLMFSDDTGIPPRYAKPAGFSQDVCGTYSGTYFQFARQEVAKEMIELWKDSKRPMPFHFGYYDNRKRSVLLYTHR